jgi:hypothetical protein
MKIPTAPAANFGVMAITTNGSAARWEIYINSTDVTVVAVSALGVGLVSTTFGSDPRFFDTWVLWSLNTETSGSDVAWTLNVVPIPLGAAFGTSGTITTATLGKITSVFANYAAPTDGMSFGHVIVSTGNGLGWLAPADTAYVGEPAGRRFHRLCQEHGIQGLVDGPNGGNWPEVLAAGGKPMGPQRPLTLLALLDECAAVEAGFYGETRELLGLAYRSGQSMYNQSPRLTVTDELVSPFAPTADDQRIVNDATVTRPQGSSARHVDQVSVDANGIFDESAERNVETDTDLVQHAAWLVAVTAEEEMTYPALAVELTKTPALVDDWLEVCPGDMARATLLPSQHPTSTVDQLIDGYTETITVYRWRVDANGSPASPWQVGVLDTDGTPDTGMARLESDASQLNSSLTSTALSMSVLVTAGPAWTQSAAQFPMRIDVGGEVVVVSAIGAPAAGVQTFTLSARSVNGVVKSHSSGAAVSAADPLTLML